MAETKIEWAEYTFNGWIGCMRVSNGPKGACANCYAADMAKRYAWAKFGGPGEGVGERHRTSEDYWKAPLRWNRKAANDNTRPFVFCASLADVFDNEVPIEWLRDLFDLIRATPHLTWLLLTKRPQNIVKRFLDTILPGEDGEVINGQGLHNRWPRNAAIGCTVVTQEEANRDIPVLLAAKAGLNPAFAFVSMEPLMERVDLTFLDISNGGPQTWVNALSGWGPAQDRRKLDWVITGGESGPKARPTPYDAFRSIRDQCATAGVPYLHKQNGEFVEPTPIDPHAIRAGRRYVVEVTQAGSFLRVGKKEAGRLLDGVEHNERPKVAA